MLTLAPTKVIAHTPISELDEPPSTGLSFESEQMRYGLPETKIGTSYEQEHQDALKRDQQEKAAASRAAAIRRNLAPKSVPERKRVPESADRQTIKDQARILVVSKWGEDHWESFDAIITRESGWNPNARNASSGACGLPQALPCAKMGGMEVDTQIRWVIRYIEGRYGSPNGAWSFWKAHHWY